MARSEVTVAAGAVVMDKTAAGWQVLVVHRPKYDDWSLPKGKLERGEDPAAAALREVEEETGVRVRLGRLLTPQEYAVRGRPKVVEYWTARPVGHHDVRGYPPNREIDKVRWLPLEQAGERLTHPRDRETLAEAMAARKRTHKVLVLRHAEARARKSWTHDDRLRPLLVPGIARSEHLVDVLTAHGVERIVTSSSTRCVQTVTSAAARLGLTLECTHALSEEDASARAVASLIATLADDQDVVLCTHRPVLPLVFQALGVDPARLEPGELLVVHRRKGRTVATDLQPRDHRTRT